MFHSPNNTESSVSDRSVRLDIQMLLQVMRVLMMMVVVRLHSGRGGGLNLRWSCSGRRPRSLTGSGRGEVRLLLARVQHHCRSGSSGGGCGRGSVLLYGVHGGGRTGVLEVMLARVMMMVEVGGRREMG